MPKIKPIETWYNGYKFRSRLEARWAVFFDAMGWRYQYEPEGFVLPSGAWYLPDFYLPDFDCWFEIKGQYPTLDERSVADQLSESFNYYILYGPCAEGEHGAYWRDVDPSENTLMDYDGPMTFAACRRCEHGVWMVLEDSGAFPLLACPTTCPCDKFPTTSRQIQQAYISAKSARFEHGESGAAK